MPLEDVTLFKDKRADALVWLTAAAAVSVLGFWYPSAVAARNAAEDDRFGAVLVFGFFFVLMASAVAIWNFLNLLKALVKDPRGAAILGVLGGILLFVAIWPVIILAWRILSAV